MALLSLQGLDWGRNENVGGLTLVPAVRSYRAVRACVGCKNTKKTKGEGIQVSSREEKLASNRR